uniref:Uncharacterized protein n=1 Tax=Anguilla anguilla TaxID=7936 RepID=A0A0E9TYQ1_ANGAN
MLKTTKHVHNVLVEKQNNPVNAS